VILRSAAKIAFVNAPIRVSMRRSCR